MKRALVVVGTAAVLLLQTGTQLSAQLFQGALPGEDVVSLTLQAGALVPTSTLPDGSKHDTGTDLGATAAWWPFARVGLRAFVNRSFTEGVHGDVFSAAAENAGRVWLYGAELAARYPMGRIAPYLAAGAGGKSYRWQYGTYEGGTAFAWTYAGGIDIRPMGSGFLGFNVEGRYHRTEYHWHGLSLVGPLPDFERDSPTVNDFLVTAGVSLNF